MVSDLQPMRQVSVSIDAEQGCVALRYTHVDGKELTPTAWQVDFPVWSSIQAHWTTDGTRPGSLKWQGLIDREVRLQFATGPQAGNAIITINGQKADVNLRTPLIGNNAWVWTASTIWRQKPFWLSAIDLFAVFGASFFVLLLILRATSNTAMNNKLKRAKASRWLLCFWVSAAVGSVLVTGLNYWQDPLQFYRRAAIPFWSTDQRSQNPGLARNYNYDTVLLGTSSVENYIPEKIANAYGWQPVKLAISGSSIHEQRQILDVALRTAQVKRVVWALDFMALGGAPDRKEDYFSPYPQYLYNTNPLDDGQYLFSATTTRDSLNALLHKLSLRCWHTPQLQLLNNWQTKYTFGEAQLWQSYQRIISGDYGQPRLEVLYRPGRYSFQQLKNNVETNILPAIRSRPEVQYTLFLPPYSIPFYLIYWHQDPQVIADWLKFRQWLADATAHLPNVVLHDFQADNRYVSHYDRYKDFLHYDSGVAEAILDEMVRAENTEKPNSMAERNRKLQQYILTTAVLAK